MRFTTKFEGFTKITSKKKVYIKFAGFKALYNLYVFVLRAQTDDPAAQPLRVNFKFKAGVDVVANNYQAFALVLAQKFISVSSDCVRQLISSNSNKHYCVKMDQHKQACSQCKVEKSIDDYSFRKDNFRRQC